eukprot:1028798-Prymnesium_polylepis.1
MRPQSEAHRQTSPAAWPSAAGRHGVAGTARHSAACGRWAVLCALPLPPSSSAASSAASADAATSPLM